MRDLGLRIDIDEIANVVGTWPPESTDPPVMTGSHIDTVATGGRFDGTLGVLAASSARDRDHRGRRRAASLAVAFFTDEEGSRFAPTCSAVSCFAGGMPLETGSRCGRSTVRVSVTSCCGIGYGGRSVSGLAPHGVRRAPHQQRPVLEAEEVTIRAVTGVQGISWTELTITGQSNHAGTTPMSMRHDAGTPRPRSQASCAALATAMGPPQVATVRAGSSSTQSRQLSSRARDATVDSVTRRRPGRRSRTRRWSSAPSSRIARASRSRIVPRADSRPSTSTSGDRARREIRARRATRPCGFPSAQVTTRRCLPGYVRPGWWFVPVSAVSVHPAELTADTDLEAGANVLLHVLLRLAASSSVGADR